MNTKFWVKLTIIWGIVALMMACTNGASQADIRLVDELNNRAYSYLYKDLQTAEQWADSALQMAYDYPIGRAEAYNLLGKMAYMQQAYLQAEEMYKMGEAASSDKLEQLQANIGRMGVYQRTSRNKEFYEYRLKAKNLLDNLYSDQHNGWSDHRLHRLFVAQCEFYMISAHYYAYLQQRDEALNNFDQVIRGEALQADTNQLLHYNYLKGVNDLCIEEAIDEQLLCRFDALYYVWLLATRKGYDYYIGGSLRGIANLLIDERRKEFFLHERTYAMHLLLPQTDTLAALNLAKESLQAFHIYGDTYQQAASRVTMAKCLNRVGLYETAIEELQQAEMLLNDKWNTAVETDINEQLSVAYAGMGNKTTSDGYRNDYLDLLDETRQDKEMESRLQTLEEESARLTAMLTVVILVSMLVVLILFIFNRKAVLLNKKHLSHLQQLQEISQHITSAIPTDARNENEVIETIEHTLKTDLKEVLDGKRCYIENRTIQSEGNVNSEEKALLKAINPYILWAIENGINSVALGDEQKRLEKQRYIHEQHIAGNKRQNLMKKACLNIVTGIQPYIDRIINEVDKLLNKGFIFNNEVKREKYEYIDELVTVINEHNDILALWIKMRQGSLNLHIESFGLSELFDIMQKGERSFKMKQLSLEVVPTDVVVKADKALTLFMINTLAENARKYTPEGGEVKIYAQQTNEYVEISVSDTGCGLSEADVKRIVDEKIYNPKDIGMDIAKDVEVLRRNKGSGFGLMNCKGIIEKYRKTNSLFNVACFRVESEPGKGSRFYFRLPLGVKKAFVTFLIGITTALQACTSPVVQEEPQDNWSPKYESLLDEASDYANDAYYANIDGLYEQTICYVDSAMQCLNKHYEQYAEAPNHFLCLLDENSPAELEWWASTYDTDFHIILDIRNEAAVAYLALNNLDEYEYNNKAYTLLYKLLGEDQSLESYFEQLRYGATQKQLLLLMILFLLLMLPIGYYLLYYRPRQKEQRNMSRLLQIYQTVSEASQTTILSDDEETLLSEEESLKEIPQQILTAIRKMFGELFGTQQVVIAICRESTRQLTFTSMDNQPIEPDVEALMKQTYESGISLTQEQWQAHPLMAEVSHHKVCIGSISVCFTIDELKPSERLLLQLLIRYLSIVLYNAVVKLSNQYMHIEEVQDENRRASWEDSQLYVQNQVLDNCLSAIKHETIYYPNRIKQLINRLQIEPMSQTEESELVTSISELIAHYKGVYMLLSQCASRQMEEVTFKRSKLSVEDVTAHARQYFDKSIKGINNELTLTIKPISEMIVGDKHQLNYLLENLIDEALSIPTDGTLTLNAECDNDFVRFSFIDHRRTPLKEELNQLFYPNLKRMRQDEHEALKGTEYLLCKQIIRDHDEYAGRRGCRINAEEWPGGGFNVYFTLPRVKN